MLRRKLLRSLLVIGSGAGLPGCLDTGPCLNSEQTLQYENLSEEAKTEVQRGVTAGELRACESFALMGYDAQYIQYQSNCYQYSIGVGGGKNPECPPYDYVLTIKKAE